MELESRYFNIEVDKNKIINCRSCGSYYIEQGVCEDCGILQEGKESLDLFSLQTDFFPRLMSFGHLFNRVRIFFAKRDKVYCHKVEWRAVEIIHKLKDINLNKKSGRAELALLMFEWPYLVRELRLLGVDSSRITYSLELLKDYKLIQDAAKILNFDKMKVKNGWKAFWSLPLLNGTLTIAMILKWSIFFISLNLIFYLLVSYVLN